MIVRQLQMSDIFRAKALWQEIFRDTEPFANHYFGHRFTPTLSFGAFDGDLLVSMALGRRVRTEKPAWDAVMISGVSTLPPYRHRGLMTELMERLLDNAKARHYDLALLSPAIPDLYAPFGFVPLTYAVEVTETEAETGIPIENVPLLAPPFWLVYAHTAGKHPLRLRRTPREMQLALDEYACDGGTALMLPKLDGYLCYLPKESGIEVTECVATSSEAYRLLLRAAAAHSPNGIAVAQLPVDCGLSGKPLRPVHGLALKEAVDLASIAKDRSTFCIERY